MNKVTLKPLTIEYLANPTTVSYHYFSAALYRDIIKGVSYGPLAYWLLSITLVYTDSDKLKANIEMCEI